MIAITEYWKEISIIVGGIVTFFTGRKTAKILEKKQNSDAVSSMQKTYDIFLEHYKEQYAALLKGNEEQRADIKKLQGQFVELNLAYAKEVERSQNWEKLHRELEDKHRKLQSQYNNLQRKYETIEAMYEKIKKDFEKHKKES